jgi:hypothetical protein
MDLFGPFKTSDMGNKYVLTIKDAFTKYAEIWAIPNKEAETVVIWYSQNGYADTGAHPSFTQMEANKS